MGWPLDKLLAQLDSPNVKRRRKAAQEMVGRDEAPVDETTVRRLARDDPDAQVRGCAVMELYVREVRDAEAAQAYRRAISGTDWQGLLAGLNGLALVGDSADIGLLEQYTRNKDSMVADTAVSAIADIEAGGRRFDRSNEDEAFLPAQLPSVRRGLPTGPDVTVLRAGGWRAWTTGLCCVVLVPLAIKGLTLEGWSGRWYLAMGVLLIWSSVLSTAWLVSLVTRKWYLALTSEGIEHPRLGAIPWGDVQGAVTTDKTLEIRLRHANAYARRAAEDKSLVDHLVNSFLGGYGLTIKVPKITIGRRLDDVADEINRRAKAARKMQNYD